MMSVAQPLHVLLQVPGALLEVYCIRRTNHSVSRLLLCCSASPVLACMHVMASLINTCCGYKDEMDHARFVAFDCDTLLCPVASCEVHAVLCLTAVSVAGTITQCLLVLDATLLSYKCLQL